MKRFLTLAALLSIPAISNAQLKISEQWTTYCDNGVEKVRVEFTYQVLAIGFDPVHSEWIGEFTDPCTGGCDGPDTVMGVRRALGQDTYTWTWQGWTLECLGTLVWRDAMMSYIAAGDEGPENRQFFVTCDDGPQTIVDECNTLPVATSTWGAIKALYR
jgi:hypothetical protein